MQQPTEKSLEIGDPDMFISRNILSFLLINFLTKQILFTTILTNNLILLQEVYLILGMIKLSNLINKLLMHTKSFESLIKVLGNLHLLSFKQPIKTKLVKII